MDEQVFLQCYGVHGSPAMLLLMKVLTALGSGWMIVPLVPLYFWRPATKRFAASLFWTFSVTAVLVFILKIIIRRPRPCNSIAGVTGLFGTPNDFSCPSGHASGSFAFGLFAVMLLMRHAHLHPARAGRCFVLSAFTLALVTAIAYSRIYLGAHFPGDVVAGAILGGTMGVVGARRHVTRLASRAASDTK
ncbi:MAG: phosphatase PAP2 family protein [Polyangiaceae bacterium]